MNSYVPNPYSQKKVELKFTLIYPEIPRFSLKLIQIIACNKIANVFTE